MAQANVEPGELRRFASDLNRFNNDLQALMGSLHGRLRGGDDGKLREVERVAGRGVVAGRGDRAADVNALAVVPGVHKRKCKCHYFSPMMMGWGGVERKLTVDSR